MAQLQVKQTCGPDDDSLKNVNVADGVYFNSGNLDLNGFDVILADTAALNNESEASRVVGGAGAVQITQSLDAPWQKTRVTWA